MKKTLIFILLVLFIVGCKEANEINETPNDTISSAPKISGEVVSDSHLNDEEPEDSGEIQQVQVAEERKPELMIDGMYWEKLKPVTGENVDLKVKVKNIGKKSVDRFSYTITIYLSNDIISKETYAYGKKLDDGETASLVQGFKFDKVGKYNAKIFIDSGLEVNEEVETNNVAEKEVTVLEAEKVETDFCTDTDGGLEYRIRGTCTDKNRYSGGLDDFCISTSQLHELYCDGNTSECLEEEWTCSKGCMDGACRESRD